jgi:hypothetical protein
LIAAPFVLDADSHPVVEVKAPRGCEHAHPAGTSTSAVRWRRATLGLSWSPPRGRGPSASPACLVGQGDSLLERREEIARAWRNCETVVSQGEVGVELDRPLEWTRAPSAELGQVAADGTPFSPFGPGRDRWTPRFRKPPRHLRRTRRSRRRPATARCSCSSVDLVSSHGWGVRRRPLEYHPRSVSQLAARGGVPRWIAFASLSPHFRNFSGTFPHNSGVSGTYHGSVCTICGKG